MRNTKKNIFNVALICFFVLAVYLCIFRNLNSGFLISNNCTLSFESYAYQNPKDLDLADLSKPIFPWGFITQIPGQDDARSQYFTVNISRINNGQQEIWIRRELKENGLDGEWKNDFLIYLPEREEWRVISAEVGSTGVFVGKLLAKSDGTIWGRNEHYPWNVSVEEYPVLSIYNPETNAFEFVTATPKNPISNEGWRNQIALGQDGIIWFFMDDRSFLFGFDTNNGQTQQYLSLSWSVSRLEIAEDSLYIQQFLGSHYLFEGEILQYFPETDELLTIEIPSDPWPWGRLFVDSNENLWFGSVGWRDPEGGWHLMHPEPEAFIENIGNESWRVSAYLVLESSDGTLWFNKTPSVGWGGMAWYNPELGEGCWFTTSLGSIVEDNNQTLWLVVDDSLYNLHLSH